MIINIHLDTSYLSKASTHSQVCGYFFMVWKVKAAVAKGKLPGKSSVFGQKMTSSLLVDKVFVCGTLIEEALAMSGHGKMSQQ